MQKLYDNISIIYQNFGKETGETIGQDNRIHISHNIEHDTNVLAIQLYNQVCFLY